MSESNFAQRYADLSNEDPYIQAVRRPGQTILRTMPYEYGGIVGGPLSAAGVATTPLTLAAGAVQTTIGMLADSDFVLTSLAVSVNQTANSDMKFNRNLTIQIQDTSTGKLFFSAPAVTSLAGGGGGFPFIFPAPRVLRPNIVLLVTGQNRDTAVNYNAMFVTLGGTRIFYNEDR